MIIVMAGLPGTGKSTLAAEIAKASGGVVLSKDALRAAAFPNPVRDYTPEQDDLVMEMIYAAVTYIDQRFPAKPIVIDGRTFSKRPQFERLQAMTKAWGSETRLIECVCEDEIARERLQSRQDSAANRDFELYRTLNAESDPLTIEHLTIDTGRVLLPEAVKRCLKYLRER